MYNDESGLIRMRVKGTNNYVDAYFSVVRYLEEATGEMKGSLMGCVFKYQSPIDPVTFTRF